MGSDLRFYSNWRWKINRDLHPGQSMAWLSRIFDNGCADFKPQTGQAAVAVDALLKSFIA